MTSFTILRMLNVKKINLVNVAISLSIFVFGFVIGKIINFPFFEMDKNINLVHIASLGTTVLIAILVSKVINKETQECRVEKDLLIKKLDDLLGLIETIHSDIFKKEIDYSSAAATIKRIRGSLTYILEITKQVPILIEKDLLEGITNTISELKDKLTNTPSNLETDIENLPLKVKNGIIHIHKDRLTLVEGVIGKLKNQILSLQLVINKG